MTAQFTTSLGHLAGRDLGDVVQVSGLPYAAPPVGALRFQRPEPPQGWEGLRDLTEPAPMAPQFPSRLAAVMGDYPAAQSEDCLTLNLWVPKGVQGPMPVMVFIHGGAFMTGGGAMACYHGADLARVAGAVVVTLSYRLGALGFLPIPGLAPANLGLHDMIAALRFLRAEVAGFGGDAGNITVMGQSAGAFAIAALLSLPEAPRLFDKAVILSAPLGLTLKSAAETVDLARAFLAHAGVDDPTPGALAGLTTAQVLAGQRGVMLQSMGTSDPDDIAPPFMPVIDGELIRDQPLNTLLAAPPVWCPMVLGATREELAAFWFDRQDIEAHAAAVLPARFETAFPGQGSATLAAFRARRAEPSALALMTDLRTAVDFLWPTMDLAHRQVQAGGAGFAYVFDWQSPDQRIGACHCLDLAFLLGDADTWQAASMLAGASAAEIAGLRRQFQASLAAFARSGRPDEGTGLPWPASAVWGGAMHFDRLSGWSQPAPGARP